MSTTALLLATLLGALVSAVVPMVNAELLTVAAAAVAPPGMAIVVGVIVALGFSRFLVLGSLGRLARFVALAVAAEAVAG